MDSKSSWEALRKQKGLDIPKDPDIKQAINSIYGQKSITDMNFECAISEKIDLTKPEDVVLALGYAYAYMYNRADDGDAEKVFKKYHELFDSYDMSTGKPIAEAQKIPSNYDLAYEIASLKSEIRGVKSRLHTLEVWRTMAGRVLLTEDE